MPITTPDSIFYADGSTPMSIEDISAAEATSVQAALVSLRNEGRIRFIELYNSKSIPNGSVVTLGSTSPDYAWTEISDIQNWHNPTVNPTRITPTIPGRYNVVLAAGWAGNGTGLRYGHIGINGVYATQRRMVSSAAVDSNGVAVVVFETSLNGTTDYVECQAYQTSGANLAGAISLSVTYLGPL